MHPEWCVLPLEIPACVRIRERRTSDRARFFSHGRAPQLSWRACTRTLSHSSVHPVYIIHMHFRSCLLFRAMQASDPHWQPHPHPIGPSHRARGPSPRPSHVTRICHQRSGCSSVGSLLASIVDAMCVPSSRPTRRFTNGVIASSHSNRTCPLHRFPRTLELRRASRSCDGPRAATSCFCEFLPLCGRTSKLLVPRVLHPEF